MWITIDNNIKASWEFVPTLYTTWIQILLYSIFITTQQCIAYSEIFTFQVKFSRMFYAKVKPWLFDKKQNSNFFVQNINLYLYTKLQCLLLFGADWMAIDVQRALRLNVVEEIPLGMNNDRYMHQCFDQKIRVPSFARRNTDHSWIIESQSNATILLLFKGKHGFITTKCFYLAIWKTEAV